MFENISRFKDIVVFKEYFIIFEIFCVYIWKVIFWVLKLNLDGIIIFIIIVGIWNVLDLLFFEGYYGNVYIDVYVEIFVRELEELLIFDIVKFVKRVKKLFFNKMYIVEELWNLERLMKEYVKFEGVVDGVFLLIDLRNIGLFEFMDFGWNKFVNIWLLIF